MSWKFGVSFVSTLTLTTALATRAHAANLGSEALYAYVGNYNTAPGNVRVISMCVNKNTLMPSARKSQCGFPATVKTATGRYTITTSNGAPLPSSPNDNGYAVWVQAVGSNAHCYEESTTWTALPGFTLTSKVRCVAPSSNANTNTDVDSDFAWSYRTDSWEYPQRGISIPNYGYARVSRADGSLVDNQTYFPVFDFDVQSSRASTGIYTVVFKRLNPGDVSPVNGYIGNVLVQKTCTADSSEGCKRAVCIPYNWTQGTFTVLDTTVNVRCYGADGALRDTDFRVFAGDEAHNSQQVFNATGGRYVWLDYASTSTSNTCFPLSNFLYRGQHEDPLGPTYPTGPIQVCKTGTGKFMVNLDSSDFLGTHYIAPYHVDDISPVVSSRAEGGVYCNPHQIICNSPNCGASSSAPPSKIEVRCYKANGSLQNAAFNLGMYY